jgi:predicted transposase YbfD/YdcC
VPQRADRRIIARAAPRGPATVGGWRLDLAGAKSLAAIGKWAADAPPHILAALGARRDPLTSAWQPPGEATVRRVLARVDPDALDRAIGTWLADQRRPPDSGPPGRPPLRAVAVDGKTLRGSGHHGHGQVHLLAVMDHTTGTVLAQTEVDHTTNEITRFRPLVEGLDLADTVLTADALHTQRAHADWLVAHKHADYLLVVKANQPALHQQLKALPWRDIPVADHTHDRGHARAELRRLQATTTIAGLDFPHATQALRITRRVRPLASRRWRTVTVHAITNLTAAQAHPARLADWIRGHWAIEALHHIRDVTFCEDDSQVRTGTAPAPRPACATSPSASCAPAATATPPQRCAATPATPPTCCPYWASPAREPDTPARCRDPVADPETIIVPAGDSPNERSVTSVVTAVGAGDSQDDTTAQPPWFGRSRSLRSLRSRSPLNELVVDPDPAVVVQNKELQADGRHLTIAGAHHLPVELDDLAQARGVVPGPENELPRSDELLVGTGHPDLQGIMAASLERGGHAQCRGGLTDLLWWFKDVDAVLGPQLANGLAALLGVRFDPDRHVAVGQLLGVDHNVLPLSWCSCR